MTIEKILNYAIKKLSLSSSPKCDSKVLLSYVMNKSISYLIGYGNTKLKLEEKKMFQKLLLRRMKGEPIAYIIKHKEFWSLSLKVIPGVFIPRPDTEKLVEVVLSKMKNSYSKILDLGTGCGSIALALASSKINYYIVGVDVNKKAISISKHNLDVLKLNNVKFMYSNWFSSIGDMTFDCIVSNPPYLSYKELTCLSQDVKYEPLNALISDNKGLSDIIHIISHAKKYLVIKGWLFIEHGWTQQKIVRLLLIKNKFFNILSFKDYSNRNRVTGGQNNR